MKKILLLTDFSKNATNAILYAMQFFSGNPCTFYLMYVHKVESYISDDLLVNSKDSVYEAIAEKPKAKLKTLKARLIKDYAHEHYEFKTVIDYDVFTDAIKQAVRKFSLDYIVMGSNGASNVKEVLMGSNTINVIEKVSCKTLVVPSAYRFQLPHEFLVVLNATTVLDQYLMDTIITFITRFKLKLHVLRLVKNIEDTTVVVNDLDNLAYLGARYQRVETDDVDKAVATYLETHPIDITTYVAQDKSFVERLFSASSNKEIKSRMNLPLLVLHSQ